MIDFATINSFFGGIDSMAANYGISLSVLVFILGLHMIISLVWTWLIIGKASYTGGMWIYRLLSFLLAFSAAAYVVYAIVNHAALISSNPLTLIQSLLQRI